MTKGERRVAVPESIALVSYENLTVRIDNMNKTVLRDWKPSHDLRQAFFNQNGIIYLDPQNYFLLDGGGTD